MLGYYNKYDSKPLTKSKVDIQLSTIFDLSLAILGQSNCTDEKPSSIIPGVCAMCAMMLTNLHEVDHESDHNFTFNRNRSLKHFRQILSSILSNEELPQIRYDTLNLLESHNGYVKDLKFTKRQKVASYTPVNLILGAYDSTPLHPGTVIIPSSELFQCDGVDYQKYRAMAYRSVDAVIADSAKNADSIVETLSRMSPTAETLFYNFKDERRHFNSISDCIIENMNHNANSMRNTHCSVDTVKYDKGLPVFIGRSQAELTKRKEKTTENEDDHNSSPLSSDCDNSHSSTSTCETGSLSEQNNFILNTGDTYTVAAGCTLNANKEEMLRISRVSDLNNIIHNNFDVHVAGSNCAKRLEEVLKSASGGDTLDANLRKMLLLAGITSIAQQKSSTLRNDPSVLLNTELSVNNFMSGEH